MYCALLVLLLLILKLNAARHGWQVPITTGPSMTTVAAQCGRKPPEALLHGCKFNTLAFLWLPPACHHEVFAQEFLGQGNWTWFIRTPYPRQGSQDAVSTRLITEGGQPSSSYCWLLSYQQPIACCIWPLSQPAVVASFLPITTTKQPNQLQ